MEDNDEMFTQNAEQRDKFFVYMKEQLRTMDDRLRNSSMYLIGFPKNKMEEMVEKTHWEDLKAVSSS